MVQNRVNTPQALCERGKRLLFLGQTEEDRRIGRRMIQDAAQQGDPEARYVLGMLLWAKEAEPVALRPRVPYLQLLWQAASDGHAQARQTLDKCCTLRCPRQELHDGCLKDHRGAPLQINRIGPLMPVKVQLQRLQGENVLTIRAKIAFFYTTEPEDRLRFEMSVVEGICAWEGTYAAFGGKVRLQVELECSKYLLGSVVVMPMMEQVWSETRDLAAKLLPGKKREKAMDLLDHRRSFASSGLKWGLRNSRFIVIQDGSGTFTDRDMIRDVAKHEFGHVLGLGDLYKSPSDGYPGVPFGTHPVLDAYSIRNGLYNLVMCDHRGPISGKDVEMVMLAFREGRMQLYQKVKPKDRISEALAL